jgi:hypothetical protein
MVHSADEFVDLALAVEGLEVKMVAPVAKVARDDKDCVLVVEVRSKGSS